MKKKIFYGWWVVLSVMPAAMVQAGALFYIFGIFYKPLMDEFGWSRGTIAAALTIYLITIGACGPLIGKLADRYGPKILIRCGAILGGILFVLLSRIDALWQFYGIYFLLGIAFAGCGNVPINTALTNWFLKKRGRAIGIAMAGVSLGAILITPMGGVFLEHFGWRNTYLVLALLAWVLVLPLNFLLMRDKPGELELLPDGDLPVSRDDLETSAGADDRPEKQAKSWTLGSAIRTRPFQLICLAYFCIYFPIGAVLGHQIIYIQDMGISMANAAAALGVTGGMGGVGKIVFGLLSDRYSPKQVTIFCALMQGAGIIILLFAKSMPLLWVYAAFFGFCMGGHLALQPLVVGYFFGIESFGLLYGVVAMSGAFGTSSGPVIAGLAFDIFGTYQGVFVSCIFLSWAAAAAIFYIRPTAKTLA